MLPLRTLCLALFGVGNAVLSGNTAEALLHCLRVLLGCVPTVVVCRSVPLCEPWEVLLDEWEIPLLCSGIEPERNRTDELRTSVLCRSQQLANLLDGVSDPREDRGHNEPSPNAASGKSPECSQSDVRHWGSGFEEIDHRCIDAHQ